MAPPSGAEVRAPPATTGDLADEVAHGRTTAVAEAVALEWTPAARAAALRSLLGVMEPDARGFAIAAVPLPWSADAMTDAFALPEDAHALLKLAEDVDWVLTQRYGDDAPTRLFSGAPWLAFRPSIVGEPILVRLAPASTADELAQAPSRGRAFFREVMAGDFDERRITGADVSDPKARLPWRVVWLSDEIVAFVSTREIGTGTSPLTAGRDLPFVGIRADLERELQDDAALLMIATGGPSLHLQVTDWVLRTRLRVARWQDGFDVEVGLELPTPEAAELAARALDAGDALSDLVPDTLLELHRAAAFTSSTAVVEGRLQLTGERASPLFLSEGMSIAAARTPP